MKRLAKLQASSASASSAPSASSSTAPPPAPSPKPKPPPAAPAPKPAAAPAPPTHRAPLVAPKKKANIAPPFDYNTWENETISQVFQVTLDVRSVPSILSRSFVLFNR